MIQKKCSNDKQKMQYVIYKSRINYKLVRISDHAASFLASNNFFFFFYSSTSSAISISMFISIN